MTLSRRDIAKLIEPTGLALVGLDRPRSSHYHLTLRRADGVAAMFILPSTPSDWRGLKNKVAELKRFARGDYNPIMQRNQK